MWFLKLILFVFCVFIILFLVYSQRNCWVQLKAVRVRVFVCFSFFWRIHKWKENWFEFVLLRGESWKMKIMYFEWGAFHSISLIAFKKKKHSWSLYLNLPFANCIRHSFGFLRMTFCSLSFFSIANMQLSVVNDLILFSLSSSFYKKISIIFFLFSFRYAYIYLCFSSEFIFNWDFR